MKTQFLEVLATRHFLVSDTEVLTGKENAYYNTYLLTNFGIVVDKPEMLTKKAVRVLATFFELSVPSGFYKNPQDMSYYTKDELLVEQLVSYFLVESANYCDRVAIFNKNLPEYTEGKEVQLREFYMLTEDEALKKLEQITIDLCNYTRPFSLTEADTFEALFDAGFYSDTEIKCKDNIFNLLEKDITFAQFLDKKDLVKLSIRYFGDYSTFNGGGSIFTDNLNRIRACLPIVNDCPLSKKQAKYFNKLLKLCHSTAIVETNARSPYRLAKQRMDAGDVIGAALVFAKNGSLLERNLKYLLSRANPVEVVKILDMLPAKNPIVLYQMLVSLLEEPNKRTFTFMQNNRLKKHIETDYESEWRKSRLNEATKQLLHNIILEKIITYYNNFPSIGKVYIADNFYKLGIPTNTSVNGVGTDVLPTGSRVPCTDEFIRAFVYWHGTTDIDLSINCIKPDGQQQTMYFGNYTSKPFGSAVQFSGDNRGCNGAEYYDFHLNDLRDMGYTMLLLAVNGYGSCFNEGTVMCGYQNKSDLETKAWAPNNIAMQFKVQGDSRACLAFGIDLITKEVVILNIIRDSQDQVINQSDFEAVRKYFNNNALEVNIGFIIENRGQLVDTPEEADIVFDDNYIPVDSQKVVKSFELEKLVTLINE